jgi:hypothetical protein
MEEEPAGWATATMIRIKVLVEGQTEETFVRDVLVPYYSRQGIYLTAILAQTSPGFKGGVVSYAKLRHQLDRLCREDAGCLVTTFVDFYKYPNDAPGRHDLAYAGMRNPYDKVHYLQQKMVEDLGHRHFIPFLMLHEFEALLFCDPVKMAEWIDDAPLEQLREIANAFASPEEINEGEMTVPSKRLLALVPKYKKTLYGPIVAGDIGLDELCRQCPHFCGWVQALMRTR